MQKGIGLKMKDFYFRMLTRVRYGVGISSKIADFAKEMGGSKIFVIADKILLETDTLQGVFESFEKAEMEYELFTDIVPEPPVKVVDEVSSVMRRVGCNLCVAIGGGSTIDTAKAVCMLQTHEGSVKDYLFGGTKTVTKPCVPLICIPTTAGTGAEVTAASVIDDTENQVKLSVTHENLIPDLALLDPSLQTSLPTFVTAATGMDALTHAIESYTTLNANPVGDAYALQAMRLIGENLRTAVSDGSNIEARGNMTVASFLAGASQRFDSAICHGNQLCGESGEIQEHRSLPGRKGRGSFSAGCRKESGRSDHQLGKRYRHSKKAFRSRCNERDVLADYQRYDEVPSAGHQPGQNYQKACGRHSGSSLLERRDQCSHYLNRMEIFLQNKEDTGTS